MPNIESTIYLRAAAVRGVRHSISYSISKSRRFPGERHSTPHSIIKRRPRSGAGDHSQRVIQYQGDAGQGERPLPARHSIIKRAAVRGVRTQRITAIGYKQIADFPIPQLIRSVRLAWVDVRDQQRNKSRPSFSQGRFFLDRFLFLDFLDFFLP